jgi:transcriptional regulator with XRE-family HTH domain
MPPRKTIADQLRAAIAKAEAKGITRYRIATDARVSRSTVTNLIDGTSANPRIDVAERIAKSIGYRLTLTPDNQ